MLPPDVEARLPASSSRNSCQGAECLKAGCRKGCALEILSCQWLNPPAAGFAIISDSGSIGIVARHAKGVFDVTHLGGTGDDHFNDVEAKDDVGHVKHPQPRHRSAKNQA